MSVSRQSSDSVALHEHPGSAASLQHVLERLDRLVDWERSARAKMRVGLSPISDLLSRIDHPERRFRSVHVTGTKGKGSVCCMIDAALRAAGLTVGRYSSPHLERINERIHLAGLPVSDEELAWGLSTILDAHDGAKLAGTPGAQASWFDVMTACAFWIFARAGVEWAIVEVGLGGRLDSTNVIESDVSVITNVDLEHTDVLGDTVEAIAAEKAGIIKPRKSVVTPIDLDSAVGKVVWSRADECSAVVHRVQLPAGATITEANIETARQVLNCLGASGIQGRVTSRLLSGADLSSQDAANAVLPGRLECFMVPRERFDEPLAVVLDGAHVRFALEGVLESLRRRPQYQTAPTVLMALGADKDAVAMIQAVNGVAESVVFVALHGARPSWDPEQLRQIASSLGIHAATATSPAEGLLRCLEARRDNWILVTGSLHLVGAVRGAVVAMQSRHDLRTLRREPTTRS